VGEEREKAFKPWGTLTVRKVKKKKFIERGHREKDRLWGLI